MKPIKVAAVELARRIGRFHDWKPGERATRQTDVVRFSGDIPPGAGGEPLQRRLVLKHPPPLITNARDVVYTPAGMAWIGGALERRYSFEEVGFRQVAVGAGWPRRRYPVASILQSQTPRTYGDWFSEHLPALSAARLGGRIVEPLLLPGHWHARPYVRRDLADLGIASEPVDASVRIDAATVINKTRFSHYWVRPEVDAVRAALRVEPRPARPGSALYLSRKGERGEGRRRTLDNDATERAMELAGVRIVRTVDCAREDYLRLAEDAETVFSDHGSAAYNLLYWKTRRYVELFDPGYWDGSFLFWTDCLGIHDVHLLRIDAGTPYAALARRIDALRRGPTEASVDRPAVDRRVRLRRAAG